MEIAVFLVALAVGVLTVAGLAERLGVPPPLLLIVVGVAASYVPGMPEIHLEPEVVLLGLLPPLLYATAIQSSLVDINANRRSILLLSIVLVAVTAIGVGAIVHTILPDISWPAALAIGAVVAPPDAVAASAIGRRIGLPRQIVTILEGESLLNDATALVALSTAIYALSNSVNAGRIGLDFVIAAGGGVAVGLVTFYVVATLRRRLTNPVLDTAISFVVPFAAYLLAEEIHASGVLAVVVAGLLLGHEAPILQSAQSRIAERINWRTIAFILENAVFLLIGLQASWIVHDVAKSSLSPLTIVSVCAATLVGVIVIRIFWVFVSRYALVRPGADLTTGTVPSWRYTLLIGWAGMRGVVTLAAAFIIPLGTQDREVLLLIAFTVVAGTLFLQGLTLPLLARRLKVPSPDPMGDALARATLLQQASKAGYAALDKLEYEDPHDIDTLVRRRVEERNYAAWERLGTTADHETPSELYARVRVTMIKAERERILEIRSSGTVPSEVVGEVLGMLDVEESMIDAASESRRDIRASSELRGHPGVACEDLDRYPEAQTHTDGTCHECVRDGTEWVALRACLDCGHIGCCDSSARQHATAHFHETGHPVMESAEPGENWRWCFVHHLTA